LNIIDFANDILDMRDRITELEREVDHYKTLFEKSKDSMDRSAEATMKNIGAVLKALIEPDSVLNQGFASIEAKSLQAKS